VKESQKCLRPRARKVCSCCNSGAVGDEVHLVFECAALAPLRQRCTDLFTDNTTNMRSFFAQHDYLRVFHYVIDCLKLHENLT